MTKKLLVVGLITGLFIVSGVSNAAAASGTFTNVQIDNNDSSKYALKVKQNVPNSPYENVNDAEVALFESWNSLTNSPLNTILVIKSWGKEQELRFDSGSSGFSSMNATIYVNKGNEKILRLKPLEAQYTLQEIQIEGRNDGDIIARLAAKKSKNVSLVFSREDPAASARYTKDTASIFRPADTNDLKVFMMGFGTVMTFLGDDNDDPSDTPGIDVGNVGIGTVSPEEKLEVNGGIRLNTTDPKPACDSVKRGVLWFTQSASGDTLDVCAYDGANYAWRAIY